MAIRDIVTRGFGNGTYSGSIPLVVTRGFSIGEVVEITVTQIDIHIRAEGATVYIPEENTRYIVQ